MARFISQSELKTFRRCRRKWWLTNIEKLEFDYPPSAGARYLGTKVHAGLEAYYRAGDGAEPSVAYDAVHAIHAEDVVKVGEWCAAKAVEYDHEFPPTEKLLDLQKETDLALIMLEGYFDWLEEEAADANLHVVAAEQELEVPFATLYDQPWHLVAKLDLQVTKVDSGFRAFLDHKTVANLTDVPKQAAQNEQGLMYNVILRMLGGPHVDGEIINMLRKVKRTGTAKPPFYGRHEVRWNVDQLNEFYGRITAIVTDIAWAEAQLAAGWSHHSVAYPNPTKDCSWDCDFYAVCTMFDDGSRIEDALSANYRRHDPLARYKLAAVKKEEEA